MVVLPAASRPTCARSSRRRVAFVSHTRAHHSSVLSHVDVDLFPTSTPCLSTYESSAVYSLSRARLAPASRPTPSWVGTRRARDPNLIPRARRHRRPHARRHRRRLRLTPRRHFTLNSLSPSRAPRSSRASRRVRRREISHRRSPIPSSTRMRAIDAVASCGGEMRATHHENAHLLLGEEALEKLGERDAHGERERGSRARVCGDDGDDG